MQRLRIIRPRSIKSGQVQAAVLATPLATPAGGPVSLDDSRLLLNRDLSLLEFQRRVLDEARDENNPLLERVKFLSILGSNLDEFFMVRLAGHRQRVAAGILEIGADGLTPVAQLEAIRSRVRLLLEEARQHLHGELLPALARAGIHVLNYKDLKPKERAAVNTYFAESVLPVLTPLAFDPRRPFPNINNLSMNLALLIRDRKGDERFAHVNVPEAIPQLVPVIRSGSTSRKRHRLEQGFVWLEQVIAANLKILFPGMEVLEAQAFRVTRDAEIVVQELEAADLLDRIERGVRERNFGSVTRLAVAIEMPPRLLEILVKNLKNLDAKDAYRLRPPLALSRLAELSRVERPDLRDSPFVPRTPPELEMPADGNADMLAAISRGDLLLHHPYDSFDPVVRFVQQAAHDPDVLAIKMTLYRVGRHSPIIKALLDACRAGKQVVVAVELMARFDEESNVEWARSLERAGAHVVYGLVNLKVHAKLALVVRREGKRIRCYAHLGTGNYNAVTARIYEDLGLLTCDANIGADLTDLFNFLTGYSAPVGFRKLLVAPVNMRKRLRELIEGEIRRQEKGEQGRLIFKMNALVDQPMIQLLYRASQAGVQIDLLVRGMCCLRPGLPGVGDNIRVRSIVGRFLEHSRVYYFRNGGADQVYVGSADLMPRNLDRRVEALFPIEDRRLVRRLRDEILAVYLDDNVKARQMQSDGTYLRVAPEEGQPVCSSQEWLLSSNNPWQ